MSLEGRKVLVTGGTRGIGRATVEAFLAEGAAVAVNGRSPESVAACLTELDGKAVPAHGDISTTDGCREIVERAVEGLGGLDILVNNAGAGGGGRIRDLEDEAWDRIVNTALRGSYFMIKHALPHLEKDRGAVVTVSSTGAISGYDGSSIQSAASGGLLSMTRALAVELAPRVRVNAVLPGPVETDLLRSFVERSAPTLQEGYDAVGSWTAMGRVAQPEEVAETIVFLASPRASYVTGALLVVDGGMTAGRAAIRKQDD